MGLSEEEYAATLAELRCLMSCQSAHLGWQMSLHGLRLLAQQGRATHAYQKRQGQP